MDDKNSKNPNDGGNNNDFKKPARPIKKVIKPLAPEKKFENINDDELELSRIIFRIKRSAEVEPSEILEIDQMSAPNVYKKPQYKHIRECDEQDVEGKLKKERVKDDESENNGDNSKLVLKKFDPSFVFEDEKSLQKEYRMLYNDQNTKLKRENLLKQRRRVLLTNNSKDIEFLDMALGSHFEIRNPAEPPLIPLGLEQGFSLSENKQLKEELQKKEYAYYFLERVSDRNEEMEDVTKIRFDDLAKAVIENHLNKPQELEIENSSELKDLLSASYHQDSSFLWNDCALNQNKSHFLNFSLEKDDDNNNDQGELFKQNNDGQAPKDDDNDNYYAPNIGEKESKKKRSQQKSRRIYKKKFWKVITKQKGSYGGYFALQMLFLCGHLMSLKIDHRQPELQLFVNIAIFGPLLVLGVLMVIFGHISHQYISMSGMWILYSIWLFSCLKSSLILFFVGEIFGTFVVFLVWKAKKWLASSVEIFAGALASILLFEKNLGFAFIGGGLGQLVKKKNEKAGAVFSTTFIGLFLVEMSRNMISGSKFEGDSVWGEFNDHKNDYMVSFWIYFLAILRQAGCFICQKRRRRTSSKSSVKKV